MNDLEPEDDIPDELRLVGHVMAHAANEILLLGRLEFNFNPKPTNITGTDADVEALSQRTAKLIQALGGPPRIVVVAPDLPRPRYDTYAEAAISEAILMFHRARSSVCRTHMHFIAGSMIEREPQLLTWPDDPKIAALMQSLTIKEFWEHAETSYIKLASLWDRLGQLLDFVFFNQAVREGWFSRSHGSNCCQLFACLRRTSSFGKLAGHSKASNVREGRWSQVVAQTA